MLYIIATPIGNLADITFRAISILSECDYILCEDTRKSFILLNHYNIKRPLISFHKFNEKRREEQIISDLKQGKKIALISDAGTPTISDPGSSLIEKCLYEKIKFTAIPGPCSIIQALLLSNFGKERFQFLGFFPKKRKERVALLKVAFEFEGVTLFFETPHRVLATVKLIAEIAPDKTIAIAREMTKVFEECIKASAGEMKNILEKRAIKGEMVLIIEGK